MSGLRLKLISQPSTPPPNYLELFYVSVIGKLQAIDENGNIATLSELANPTTYRLAKIRLITASGTYTPTVAQMKALYVECIGGGGGGGGGVGTSTGAVSLGSGGGGGGYSSVFLSTVKSSYSVTVGNGGTSGTPGSTANSGGDTTFDSPSVCTAKGGAGGQSLASATAGNQLLLGGAGGLLSGGVGDLCIGGCAGGIAIATSTHIAKGGDGAAAYFGGRVAGLISYNSSTISSISYGGGGGGVGLPQNQAAATGGSGASGAIRVWEFV